MEEYLLSGSSHYQKDPTFEYWSNICFFRIEEKCASLKTFTNTTDQYRKCKNNFSDIF